MVKPDGMQRAKTGEIIQMFERRGFKLCAMKLLEDKNGDLLKRHYDDLKDMPFFPRLFKYMKSGPLLAMVWEGDNVIKTSRKLIGATKPDDRAPGTTRFNHAISNNNLIHGSDSVESAEKEISIWFSPKEVNQWN